MSTSTKPLGGASASTSAPGERTYFETQRATLLGEIGVVRPFTPPRQASSVIATCTQTNTPQSLEHVLANINKLNRSLEGVIAVGNEFGSVEALWSQFENVMGHEPAQNEEDKSEGEGGSERGDEDRGEEGSEVDDSRI
jgi:DASH complex subunit DAD1